MRRISHIPSLLKTPLGAFTVFLVAALAVTVIVYLSNESRAKTERATTDQSWSLVARPVTADDHLVGTTTAEIQIIAYSSIACPSCAVLFNRQVPRLQAAFGTSTLVFAYRHNPIPEVPNAQVQEPAAECVYQLGGNDAFWKFAHLLFPVARDADTTDVSHLGGLAAEAGVSESDFTACMAAGRGQARVNQDKREAAVAGMTVDPSLLLKSPHRALILSGNYYNQIYTAIAYLLTVEQQIAAQQAGSS
jgi:protein-disulfide isomerase